LAGALSALGDTSIELGDPRDALEQYRQAFQLLQIIADRDPASVSSRGNLGGALNNIGTALLYAQEYDEARRSFSDAVRLLEPLALEDSRNTFVRRTLGKSYYALATALLAQDKDLARANYRKCRDLRQQLAEIDQRDVRAQTDLLLALARCGQHAEAARLADRLSDTAEKNSGQLFQLACGFALCSLSLSTEKGPVADMDAMMLAEEYAAKTIDTLRQAIAHGFRSVAALRLDPDLEPVRARPEFAALVKELEGMVSAADDLP
jgi:tetratricopeptide (TPR) repeat protein